MEGVMLGGGWRDGQTNRSRAGCGAGCGSSRMNGAMGGGQECWPAGRDNPVVWREPGQVWNVPNRSPGRWGRFGHREKVGRSAGRSAGRLWGENGVRSAHIRLSRVFGFGRNRDVGAVCDRKGSCVPSRGWGRWTKRSPVATMPPLHPDGLAGRFGRARVRVGAADGRSWRASASSGRRRPGSSGAGVGV